MKNSALIFTFILLFTFLAKADVPPDPGYTRVSLDLVTETTEDLSDYRFFLDFYGDLREVEVKSKGRTVIPPSGGGARYRSGTLLAIPKKSLSGFSDEKLSPEQLASLSKSIKSKELAGVAELARHSFSADIPKGEKPPEVYYTIKREENTLKAERVSNEKPKSNTTSAESISNGSRATYIIAGIFIALAVFVTGVFAFRKATKKV
jgi:hypothetical protein